jgi:hypothetical protein
MLRRSLLRLTAVVAIAGLVPARSVAATVELLMFETPGCPWCALWRKEVGAAYPQSDEGRYAPLRQLRLGAALPDGIALKEPVTASPTFVLVAGGREIGRITGYPGADFFWALVGELIEKAKAKPS